MGVGLQTYETKPCVEPWFIYLHPSFIAYYLLNFVNYCKLLNTKTAYFSFIKTKIKLFLYFYSQKWTAPRLLSYVENSLSCSRRDMLYQEVQGDSEWMYIFTSQSFGTQWILKHPPRNQLISCWENENYFLISNNPSMQIS